LLGRSNAFEVFTNSFTKGLCIYLPLKNEKLITSQRIKNKTHESGLSYFQGCKQKSANR